MSRRFSMFTSAVVFALFLVPSTLPSQSQATTGVIRGTVIGPDSTPVGGATIILRELGTNFQRTLTAEASGTFIASLLPLGTYEITARSVGFQEVQRAGVVVRVGETIDLQLQLGAAVRLEAVVVEARPRLVDTEQSEAATRLPTEAVSGLPNNGRNFLELTTLTPNVAIVQGPDGDELSIAGQRGIHNNVSVDGADFNNPFFGEQRGGQRPPFTFNLDAVQEVVVVSQGANAEFGRSGGGFVNVITKSGTNDFRGSLHYFGKYDAFSAVAQHTDAATSAVSLRDPDFNQHQFGFTLGGPIVRDKAFFFVAYDQQLRDDTRQQDPNRIGSTELRDWADTAFGAALAGDYGSISRTDDARAFLAKVDMRLGRQHNATLRYGYTWSEQVNGTFDVDSWLRSANATEKDFSHSITGSLQSVLSSRISNEFRFQWSREDRPRPYLGPTFPGIPAPPGVTTVTGDRPFPDIAMDFGGEFRLGLPFFIPVEYYDTRVQLLNNISYATGNHLFKLGAEWNRVESVQTFIGFANGRFIFSSVDGFLQYAANGPDYVECDDNTTSLTGSCADPNASVEGPLLLYLQQAGVGGRTVEEAGTQSIPQNEIALFLQDSWKPMPNLTLNLGLRWEAQIQPDPITPPADVFYSDFVGTSVTTSVGTYEFPSDGTIPSDWSMWQPRVGFAWDLSGRGETVVRGNAGLYYSRIPGLNLASSRSTNGSIGQTIFRSSETGGAPAIDSLLPNPSGDPFAPDIFVFDQDFRNPRTFSANLGIEREIIEDVSVSLDYTHASTDNLTRFVNRNDPVFGEHPDGCIASFVAAGPWCNGLDLDDDGTPDNGVNALNVVESSAKSRYNGITIGLKRFADPVQFQINYTLSWDKSDDDNERDPFTLRYFSADDFTPEYNWSDRDQRHRINAWFLYRLPGDVLFNNRVSYYSAQPVSEKCGPGNTGTGERASDLQDPDRLCPDGSVLPRNTLRKDNAFFSWDIRLSRMFRLGPGAFEAILEVFNVTNADNFIDPSFGGLLFNFDGTVQSGLGTPRQMQVGGRYVF